MLLSLLTLAVIGYGSVLRSSVDDDGNGVPSLRRNDTTQLFNMTGLEGLSAKCIQAMESPVSCPNDGMMLLSQADAISGIAAPELLTADDLAALCTTSCSNSLASLGRAVESACSGDMLTFAPSNSTVYIPGTEAQESIFGGGGETFRPSLALDIILLKYKIGCLRDSAVSGSDGWCYLRVNKGLTQACDDCELGAFRAQMENPDNYDADLAVQYTSQVSSCHKSLAPIATPTKSVFISSATITTTETCRGTMVPVAADANCDDFARTHSIGTEQLLSLNGLTSGCVGFPGSKSSLCIVGSCDTHTVTKNDTCSSIVQKARIADVQFISWNPMLSPRGCNRDIARMVGHVVCISNPLGYTPPGKTGSGPKTTSSSVPGNIVGFDDLPEISTIWTHEPLTTKTSTAGDAYYTPTYELANGSISGCYYMYDNDIHRLSCRGVSTLYGVDVATWVRWNPSVWKGVPGDEVAECYLETNTRYCGLFWDPTLAPPRNNTESPYPPKPSDATAGATDKCYVWDKTPATAEDNLCITFMKDWGITIDQFYAWNPAVGNHCQSLWLNTSYCVSAEDPTPNTTSSTTARVSSIITSGGPPAPSTTSKTSKPPTITAKPSTTTIKVTPPGPTQSGIPAKCNKFALTQDGDGCKSFATRNKITLAQLYSWNPVLKNACKNFWTKEAYCIGVSA